MKHKPTQLISLSSYCPQAKVWDKVDMLYYFVNMEDNYNHTFVPTVIPKDMSYPKSKLKGAGIYGFLRSILP